MQMSTISILVILTIILAIIRACGKRAARNLPLPPGPKKYPLIGNLLDAPTKHQWIRYAQWSKEFNSDIIHLQVFGSSIIVLNSFEAANELLSRRSALYSNRPISTMISELMGWTYIFSLLPYGDAWRARRRVFWQEFNPANSKNHQPLQVKNARDLLRRLLDTPDDFQRHIRYTLGASIISTVYGLDVQPIDDPYITTAENALHYVADAAIPGAFMVDNLPILKYIPRWIPGAGFQVFAEKARYAVNQMIEIPYLNARELLIKGEGAPSMLSRSFRDNPPFLDGGCDEQVIKHAAAVAYAGGTETTPSALSTFIAAMVLYKDVQEKAQKELDNHLGHRLPEFSDREHLPYAHAVMLEVLRWEPVTPLGLAHSLIAEDEYKGYRLPKDSIVFGNTWAILRDENIFHEPEKFKPERFIKNGKVNTDLGEVVAAFGFGRRICPGRYMAMDSLWISLTSILSIYNIIKATDTNGRDIEPSIVYNPAFIRHLLPFKCSIKPRSAKAEKMIRDSISI